jgi:hypothetical protein
MTEICKQCERKIAADRKFCKYCGVSTSHDVPAPPLPEPLPPLKKKGNVLPIIMGTLIVCVMGLIGWAIAQQSKRPWNPTVFFFASTQQLAKGEQCTLQWSVGGNATVQINGEVVPVSGTRVVSPDETTSYRLVASGPSGASESREIIVNVSSGSGVPPAIQFSGDRESIIRGQTATLKWAVTGADLVRIEPDFDSVSPEGERQVSPQKTTDYALTAEGPGGKVTSHFILRVDEPPRPGVSTFDAVPNPVSRGTDVQLRWSVMNASHISIDPDVGAIAVSGSVTVRPLKTTDYVLTAENAAGARVSRSVTVGVNTPLQPTIELTGDHPQITRGQTLTLRWFVTGATSVRVDPGFDKLPTQGEMTISPTHSGDYTLTAEGPGGAASKHFNVRVAPRIAAFEAVPASADQCQVVVLRWTVESASTVSVDPGIGIVSPTSGYKVVRPLQTTRYVLKADGPGGSASRDVTISVSRATRSTCAP